MLFMVVERFADAREVYRRVREGGRSLPEGLSYVDSWVRADLRGCFQLMECEDLRVLQEWVLQWRGSGTTFEIVPVVTSKETREVVGPHLDKE